MTQPIVVTGATGTVGSRVVEQLRAAGASVRAAVRDPGRVPSEPRLEAVAIDFARPETLEAAMTGADHLFLLTAFVPEMVEMSHALVDAAKAAGIEHVVKLSAIGAGPGASIALGEWHTKGEKYLEDSGIGFTYLRPNSFMQNYVTYYGETIKTQNAFYLPHGKGKMSLVDPGDVAAVAVKTLLACIIHDLAASCGDRPSSRSVLALHSSTYCEYAFLVHRAPRRSTTTRSPPS
jgi:uncharacterized protein YbjT (DUF2867 family)